MAILYELLTGPESVRIDSAPEDPVQIGEPA
jgi:hypothetical protein